MIPADIQTIVDEAKKGTLQKRDVQKMVTYFLSLSDEDLLDMRRLNLPFKFLAAMGVSSPTLCNKLAEAVCKRDGITPEVRAAADKKAAALRKDVEHKQYGTKTLLPPK